MEKTTPKISVIIPFYNVGIYAKYCLESLILQDYHNCEFVCVDDGSTDNTLSILKTYDTDKRVKIFQKDNGGLSDARNYGLNVATGHYITFIDGDDYVHPRYLSLLAEAIDKEKKSIAISPLKIIKFKEPMDITADWMNNATYNTIDKKEVIVKILYDELSVSACGKLVPKEAYENNRFPVGKVSEEVATIGKLLQQFDSYSIIDQPLYGYVMRPNSIGHKKKVLYKDIKDRIDALKLFETIIKQEFDISKDSTLEKALLYRWGLRYVDMANMYDNVIDNKEAALTTKKEVKGWLKKHIKSIVRDKTAPKMQRMRMSIYTFFPKTYNVLFSIYQKIKYNV